MSATSIIQLAIDTANRKNGEIVEQVHEQTIREICRLALEQTDEAASELVICFADLTQIEALYVAAKCSVEIGQDFCDLLAVAMSGRDAYILESQAMPLVRLFDRGGADELIRDLSHREVIAGITLIPLIHKLRGIGEAIASRLVAVSNGQIEEVA